MTNLKTELASIKIQIAKRSVMSEANLKKAYKNLRIKLQGLTVTVAVLAAYLNYTIAVSLIEGRNTFSISFQVLSWLFVALFSYSTSIRLFISLINGKDAKELNDFVNAYLKLVADEAICATVLNEEESIRYKSEI